MHKLKKILFFIFLSMLFAACSSIEIFKENTEFAPYRNYESFVIINREIGHSSFRDQYVDALVADAIQHNFETMGLVYNRQNPDLIIRYTSNEDIRQKDVYNTMYPMWGRRVWDPWMFDPRWMNQQNPMTSKNYELLQLVVDFIDPNKDKMLMRLTAVSEVNSPNEKKKKAVKSVDKIAESYIKHVK